MHKYHTVRLKPLGITCKVAHGTSLHDLLATYGVEFPCGGNGTCGNCKVKLLGGNIETSRKHAELLLKKGMDKSWRLACMSQVTDDLCIELQQDTTVIQTDRTSFPFTPEEGYGIAIDLGSTTIVSQLVNLNDNRVEADHTSINPQSKLGADIISRISYALQSEQHRTALQQLVRDCIYGHIRHLLQAGAQPLRKIVIVGNSVMHHLFCGLDVRPLAAYPFNSPHNASQTFSPQDLQWDIPPCSIRFMPNISHFVGSDILAGIQACRMFESDTYQALIDLGTNGEIVIGNRNHMVCTSTAAGPAFEGINISQGMRATNGAIYRVDTAAEGFTCRVIGNTSPRGICGSGLVDAIHALLEVGAIDFTGNFTAADCPAIPLTGSITLIPEDIREFQLAKSAVRTGFQLVMQQLGIQAQAIEHVYLAGGLGNYLDIHKASALGLLESLSSTQPVRLSNAALLGAKQFLFNANQKHINDWFSHITYCPLETHPDFQDWYCENMFFGNTSVFG